MRRYLVIGAALIATFGIVVAMLFGGLEEGDTLWPLAWVTWAPVGMLILLRRPGNGVGLTALMIGLSWGLSFFFLAAANTSLPLELRVWFELFNVVLGMVPWLGIIWLLLIFPSGRLQGRLEGLTGLALVVFGALGLLSFLFSTESMEGPSGLPSPLAQERLAEITRWIVAETGFFVVIGITTAAVIAMAVRWRRSTGVERHQYRWLLLGAISFVAVLFLAQMVPDDSSGLYLWLLSGAAIPIVIGIAIIRYRLFEIDRVLSRTVTYALLIAILAAGFFGVAALVGSQVSEEPLFVAAATLGAAALFNPLRRFLQRWVDRRFNRSHYDAERVMDEFALTLRDQMDPDQVLSGWAGVVAETVQPSAVGVWVRR